jgi:nitrate reductase gamma subunit
VQLTIGLITLPYSFGHEDASVMLALSDWAQRIVTFRPDAAGLVALAWPYKLHLVLGMTIFLLLPFSRLVHVWSGFASIAYVLPPVSVGAIPPAQSAKRPQHAASPQLEESDLSRDGYCADPG